MDYFDGTICHVSDVGAAAQQLNGKFKLENCGFFSKCTHNVENFDITQPSGGYVEIIYCETDWIKTAPVVIITLIIIWYIWQKMKTLNFKREQENTNNSIGNNSSNSSYKSSYNPYSKSRH